MSHPETDRSPNINTNGAATFLGNTESTPVRPDPSPIEINAKITHLYETLVESANKYPGVDGWKMKVNYLQAWVRDLQEQITALLQNAEQMEMAAVTEVTRLDYGLKQSAKMALEYLDKLVECDSQVQDLVNQKTKMVSMALSQERLQTRINNLQNDVKSLLQLIQRARNTGSWSLDGLTFKEVVWNDDFVGTLSGETPQLHVSEDRTRGNKSPKTDDDIIPDDVQSDFALWKKKAMEAALQVKELQKDAVDNKNTIESLLAQFEDKQCLLDSTLRENEKLSSQIKAHAEKIALRDKEIETVKKNLSDLEKRTRGNKSPKTDDGNTLDGVQSDLTLWKKKATEAAIKIKDLQQDAFVNKNTISSLQKQSAERLSLLDSALKENEKLSSQIQAHAEKMSLKDKEIEKVKKTLSDLEKSSKDEKAALTAEVAEKHDEIRSLTEKNKQLENRCRDANMQTQLKDDIIKQMRKDIKQLKDSEGSHNSISTSPTAPEITSEGSRNSISTSQTAPEITIDVSEDKDSENTSETIDAKINDEHARIHITHCITDSDLQKLDQTEVDNLKSQLSEAKDEIESLKSNLKTKDKMLANQMEMFGVQQDTLNMTQMELKEAQKRLKELEAINQALEELKCKCESEKAVKYALAKAEKRNEEQQATIRNLQEALRSTKNLLEEFQRKEAVDVDLKRENYELRNINRSLRKKIAEIKNLLGVTDDKSKMAEENTTKFKYQFSFMSRLKDLSDEDNKQLHAALEKLNKDLDTLLDETSEQEQQNSMETSPIGGVNNMEEGLRRLASQLQKKSMEVRTLQLALSKEKDTVFHSKIAYGFASETLKCYLVQTESLYKVKDILQEKSKNLVCQNNILQEEISSLQKELTGANMYCNEMCREFLETVEFVHQWMLKKHTLHSRLTVNLQQKMYAIKNLRRERKCLRRSVNVLHNNVRFLKRKLYEDDHYKNRSYPCPVIKVLQQCQSSATCWPERLKEM